MDPSGGEIGGQTNSFADLPQILLRVDRLEMLQRTSLPKFLCFLPLRPNLLHDLLQTMYNGRRL